MTETEKQESQKTVVSFVAGLLIGALLVWVFSSPGDNAPTEEMSDDDASEVMNDDTAATDEVVVVEDNTSTPVSTMKTGEGAVTVSNQSASDSIVIDSATFPNDEGWIAVRTYQNDQLGNILGAARFSKEQNLVPEAVPLLVPTVAGREYAVVFFTEDGDHEFNLAMDSQVEGVWETFTAK